MSKMLQVRNVPDDVHAKLRARAAAAGMSLSEYTLRRLVEDVEQPTLDEVFAESERSGVSMSLADTLADLEAGRAER